MHFHLQKFVSFCGLRAHGPCSSSGAGYGDSWRKRTYLVAREGGATHTNAAAYRAWVRCGFALGIGNGVLWGGLGAARPLIDASRFALAFPRRTQQKTGNTQGFPRNPFPDQGAGEAPAATKLLRLPSLRGDEELHTSMRCVPFDRSQSSIVENPCGGRVSHNAFLWLLL